MSLSRSSFTVLLVTIAFSGIAFHAAAQSKGPSPLTAPRIQPDKLRTLKLVAPLSTTAKLALVAPSGTATAADLDASFTLSPRAPFVNDTTSMDFQYPILINSRESAVEFGGGVPTQLPRMFLYFEGIADRRYLVDCIVDSAQPIVMAAHSERIGVRVDQVQTTTATMTPSSGHVALVIPKSADARRFSVSITSSSAWLLRSCEITPVR